MDVLGLLTAYQAPAVVTAAHRVGLFDALHAGPADAAELAQRLGTAPAPTTSLLESLVGLGLAVRGDAGYTLTPQAVRDLGQQGRFRRIVEKEASLARLWLELADVVRGEGPLLPPWRDRLVREPAAALAFLEALADLAVHAGPDLRRLPELTRGRVLDVGGGLGAHARLLAGAGASVTLVELPPVTEWARARLADLSPRVRVVAADVLEGSSCGVDASSHDAALVSHLLHDLPEADALRALHAVTGAVRPGGRVVVSDIAGETGPGAFGPMFDLMMHVETGGAAHPLDRLEGMMREAGVHDVRRVAQFEPATVLAGHRP